MAAHRLNLNENQIHILKLTYKFRYLTANNLSRRLGIARQSAHAALVTLERRGCLGKLYGKTYKLAGKSARYYLTLDAVKLLSDKKYGLNKNVLRTRRNEAGKGAEFVDLQVALFKMYLDIKESTSDDLVILTATEMAALGGFMRPYPGLYMQNRTSGKQYFIELTDGQHLFIAKKRARKYIDYYDSDAWDWGKYPEVVLIRSQTNERKQLNWYIGQKMEDAYLDEGDIRIEAKSWNGAFLR